MNPYVISEDICVLLAAWTKQNDFLPPSDAFFADLRLEMKIFLEKIFSQVKFISATKLIKGIEQLLANCPWPVVSLDKSYWQSKFELEINRSVDDSLVDSGETARFNRPNIEKQIQILKTAKLKVIVLVDDVIFSGKALSQIIMRLREAGIEVAMAVAGIGIASGVKAINSCGVKVKTVCFYDEVIDEICERDFYPGVPYSGRLVKDAKRETGTPYLYPFGKPLEWASIPEEHCEEFSVFCLKQSLKLWQEVERISHRPICCHDLSRLPLGAPTDDINFVDYLASLV